MRVRWPLFWSSQLHASIAFGAIYILFWFATLFLQDAVEPQGLLLNSSASADLPTLIGLPAFLIAPVIAWLVCQAGVPLDANTVAANIRVLILYFIAIVWPLPLLLYQWDVYLSSVAGKESDILVWALILGTIATYISGTVFSSKYLGIRNALIALTLSILSWGLFVVVASGLGVNRSATAALALLVFWILFGWMIWAVRRSKAGSLVAAWSSAVYLMTFPIMMFLVATVIDKETSATSNEISKIVLVLGVPCYAVMSVPALKTLVRYRNYPRR